MKIAGENASRRPHHCATRGGEIEHLAPIVVRDINAVLDMDKITRHCMIMPIDSALGPDANQLLENLEI